MKIYFLTQNPHKKEEVQQYFNSPKVKDRYDIELLVVERGLQEILHPDIEVIVRAKALEAYKYLGVPCVVEHGGIFIEGLNKLPGGVGQIIWNAVGDGMCNFLKEKDSRVAFARSIIGYCDSRCISTFTGETKGSITKESRGDYHFNWDPIFIPEGYTQTYGEMGPQMKQATSQAMKAWDNFLDGIMNTE